MRHIVCLIFLLYGGIYANAQSRVYTEAGLQGVRYLDTKGGEALVWGGYLYSATSFRNEHLAFVAEPLIRWESYSHKIGARFLEEDPYRYTFSFQEMYVEGRFDNTSFGIGKRKRDFCVLQESLLCPEDAWSSHDFIDPLEGVDNAMGVKSMWMNLSLSRWTLMLLYAPQRIVSKLPYRGRWFLLDGETFSKTVHEVEGDNLLLVLDRTEGSVHMRLSAYRGSDSVPDTQIHEEEDGLVLTYHYPERTSLMTSLSYYGKLIARASGGYSYSGGVNRLEFGGELEKQFLGYRSTRTLLLGSLFFKSLDGGVSTFSTSYHLRYGWNQSIYGGFEFENQSFKVRLPVLLQHLDSFVFIPRVSYTKTCTKGCASVEFGIEALLLDGSKDTLLGRYKKNDRGEVFMVISF